MTAVRSQYILVCPKQHCVLCCLQCSVCNMPCVPCVWVVHLLNVVCSVRIMDWCAACSVFSVQCSVCSFQCAVCSVQCVVCAMCAMCDGTPHSAAAACGLFCPSAEWTTKPLLSSHQKCTHPRALQRSTCTPVCAVCRVNWAVCTVQVGQCVLRGQ